jgi:hypothetical protein
MQIHKRSEMRRFAKILLLGIAAFSLYTLSASANDLSVTIGLKARFNKLTASVSDSAVVFDGASDTAILLGPSLKLAYKKLFVGVTWLQTVQRRYKLEYFNIAQNEMYTTDMSVSEIDALAGYMFHPRFGAFVGYKSISSESTPVATSPTTSLYYDLVLKGPAIGVIGNVPLGKLPMLAVASASYIAATEYSFAPTVDDQKAAGYALEIGVTYDPFENTVFYLGLKLQQYEADLGDEWKSLGLTISGDYRF